MNAVEEIEAAIAKLSELRDYATPGPWASYKWDWRIVVAGQGDDDNAEVIFDSRHHGDGELVEVLHRTIDAQLAILGRGLEILRTSMGKAETAVELQIMLARAINGTS